MGFCRICRYGISMFVALLYGYYVSNEILPISHTCWLSVHLVLFIFIYHLLSGFHPAGKYHFPHQDRKNGEVFTDKVSVTFTDIKKIEMSRHKFSLKGIFQEDILIQTVDQKTIRIPTWNIIPNPLFFEAVERYILPHLSEEAKSNWIGQFTEVQRKAYLKEFENHPKL